MSTSASYTVEYLIRNSVTAITGQEIWGQRAGTLTTDEAWARAYAETEAEESGIPHRVRLTETLCTFRPAEATPPETEPR